MLFVLVLDTFDTLVRASTISCLAARLLCRRPGDVRDRNARRLHLRGATGAGAAVLVVLTMQAGAYYFYDTVAY